MNWCEVPLSHKSQYFNKDTKERRKKVSLKLNESYLNIPSVSTTERISKLKGRIFTDVLANETTNAKFYSLHFKFFCLFGKIITLRPGNLIDGKTL